MEERYIATIDPGSSKIALSVARVVGDNAEVIYYKEFRSDGIRASQVLNPGLASAAVQTAVKEAEEELKIKILQVVVTLPRYCVHQESAPGRLDRTDPGSCITQEEIDLLKNCATDDYPLDESGTEKVFGAVAQSFTTDDLIRCPERDVVGSVSDRLEGNFKIFIGKKKLADNLEKVFQKNGMAVIRSYFSPEVTAEAVLTDEEKENGVALVEIGAGVSSVTIFQNRIMRHYGAIPFGAKNITLDIKHECGFSLALAENIKLGFGACLPEKLLSMSEKILQINDDETGSYKHLPIKYLSEIITARQREIFDALLFEIGRSGYADKLRSGVVLTGGGAMLTNCGNLLKEMSGYTVRTGFPRQRHFSAATCPGILETSAATSVGMILRAKGDSHVNCLEDPAETLARIKAENPQEEEQDGPDYEGTVFAPAEEGDNPAGEAAKASPKKATEKKKPARNRVTFFTKVKDSLGGIIGDLYESAE